MILRPPPTLTISQWADRERKIPEGTAAEPGQWHTSRAEYQRGIMDAISDPAIETVVVKKGTQVGCTEVILNAIGFHIDYDPAPTLIILPTVEAGEAWSNERLAPMLAATETLRAKVAEPLSRSGENRIRYKSFPGGYVAIVGANAPTGLRMRPVGIGGAPSVGSRGARLKRCTGSARGRPRRPYPYRHGRR